MRYCTECLTTDLRPNASFENGVCIACRYAQSNHAEHASAKLAILRDKIQESFRKYRKPPDYDCIIGVSGGKDSTRQAHWVRDRLGLRPLLICAAYPPRQMTDIGADNLSNLIRMGFDVIVATPAPQTAAQLTLQSFRQFGNVCKSTEISLFSTVPRLAIKLGVRIIFWGENPALQVGDAAVEGIDEFDGNELRNLNTLTEGGNQWIHDTVKAPYLGGHYLYPDELQFEKHKINIFYLGAAWDDWSSDGNATYAALQGLTLRPHEEMDTGDFLNASMLDEEFTNINLMLKYYKFGFGRATDDVCELIREGKISRDDAIRVVQQYDGVCSDRIIRRFCDYVSISEAEFWQTAKSWVNPALFDCSGPGRPRPLFTVGRDHVG